MPLSYAGEQENGRMGGKVTEGCKQVMPGSTEISFRSNLQRHRIKGVRQVKVADLLGFNQGCWAGNRRGCARMNSPR